ncbi:hypothetical protein M433DRAFT_265714 [Acidomyces richmondensis BFW]|nr:MAG: hypothetical protein FE78DRAFT_414010 [Acidomyces sp. 'richmondensis']KYG45210.1 hypothetical protein M433DRAFT_265714 [Acidomyces richmondensis BFW]
MAAWVRNFGYSMLDRTTFDGWPSSCRGPANGFFAYGRCLRRWKAGFHPAAFGSPYDARKATRRRATMRNLAMLCYLQCLLSQMMQSVVPLNNMYPCVAFDVDRASHPPHAPHFLAPLGGPQC